MSEHDEAGSAVAFPPPPPPPPPQPAARSASTAVRPISAVSESFLLTLPPQSPSTGASPHAPGSPRREWPSIRAFEARRNSEPVKNPWFLHESRCLASIREVAVLPR